jgi:hypothetical protein
MQEPLMLQAGTGTAETSMNEYLNAALMQTELLRKMLYSLRKGSDLSLAAWSEAFEASQRTVDHIHKAMTLAQEVFDGHVVQVSGSLLEDLICDEFQCLTWK